MKRKVPMLWEKEESRCSGFSGRPWCWWATPCEVGACTLVYFG